MSLISRNAPTISGSTDDMRDFLRFVYKHESILKQYGAIKIVPPTEFKDFLKKHRIKLESPSIIQQVTKLNHDDLTYSVTEIPYVVEKKPNQLLPVNEITFWQSLSQHNNQQYRSRASILSEKSFFLKRICRTSFDIYQLPHRSLLRFCNNSILRQFVPSLIRAHEPGTVFPLASARQRLFTFNYHHEGGVRYWYIVPASERKALEDIYQQQKNSICLDHGRILINPLMFDKYNIRYYQLIQQPDEIVILAAGALSQSFTEDASWYETIDFVLPSWLADGHADAQTSCSCRSNITSFPKRIDTKIFNRTLIQQYIKSNLSTGTDDESLYNIDMDIEETSIYSDISLPSVNQLSNQTVELSSDNNSFNSNQIDNNNYQKLLDAPMESTLLRETCEYPYPAMTHPSQISFEPLSQLPSQQDFYEENMGTLSDKSRFLSYEEILNIISSPSTTARSTESQMEEQMYDQRNILNYSSAYDKNYHTKNTRNRNSMKKKRKKKIKNVNKTLLIFGMKKEVTKADIHHHFDGYKKVTIKQSQAPPYYNYAFVLHRSRLEAERNRNKPIDHLLFGDDCRVEFTRKNDDGSNKHCNSGKWNVLVKQIPENVTEECIRNLFIGCHSMMYIPARIVNKKNTESTSTSKTKVLWGYAFLLYTDAQEAADVVNNADKFQISNQPLSVCFFDDRMSSSRKRKQINDLHRLS